MSARVQAYTPNLTRSPFEKKDLEQSVSARFEEQVRRYPDRTAVRTPNVTLTYSALNLHYLSSGLDIDVTLPADLSDGQLASLELGDFDALKRKLGAREIRFSRTVRNGPGIVITESIAVSRLD